MLYNVLNRLLLKLAPIRIPKITGLHYFAILFWRRPFQSFDTASNTMTHCLSATKIACVLLLLIISANAAIDSSSETAVVVTGAANVTTFGWTPTQATYGYTILPNCNVRGTRVGNVCTVALRCGILPTLSASNVPFYFTNALPSEFSAVAGASFLQNSAYYINNILTNSITTIVIFDQRSILLQQTSPVLTPTTSLKIPDFTEWIVTYIV